MENNDNYGRGNIGSGKTANVEFVSANPTGPLTVGHGRQAVLGDTIANILEWHNYKVTREYYYNDAGRQIDILTASVITKLLQKNLGNFSPQNTYKGKYIEEIGIAFSKEKVVSYKEPKLIINNLPGDAEEEIDQIISNLKEMDKKIWNEVKNFSLKNILNLIKQDLENFNVNFDSKQLFDYFWVINLMPLLLNRPQIEKCKSL